MKEYAGGIRRINKDNPRHSPMSVTLADIDVQRAAGWPDFHPEDYCHRCGKQNVSWWTDSGTWNPVMRSAGTFGLWQEIICMACFVELAGPGKSWTIEHDGASYRLVKL